MSNNLKKINRLLNQILLRTKFLGFVVFLCFQADFSVAFSQGKSSSQNILDLDIQTRVLIEKVKSISELNHENSYALNREYINLSLKRGIEEYSNGHFHGAEYNLNYFLKLTHRPSIEQLITAQYYLTLIKDKQGSTEETIAQIIRFFSVFNGVDLDKVIENKGKIDHVFELAFSNIYDQSFAILDANSIFLNLEKVQHIILPKEFHNQGRFLITSLALQSKYKNSENILDELYKYDKENEEYIFLKSQEAIRSGDYSEGINNLTRLLENSQQDPFKSIVYLSIARTHFMTKKFEESLHFYNLVAIESFLKPRAQYESIFAALKSNQKSAAIALADEFLINFKNDKNYTIVKKIKEQISIQGHDLAAFQRESSENQNKNEKLFAEYLENDSTLLNSENIYNFVASADSTYSLPEDYKFIKLAIEQRNTLLNKDKLLYLTLKQTIKKFLDLEGSQHIPHIAYMLNVADGFLEKQMELVEKAVILNFSLVANSTSREETEKFKLLLKRLEDIKTRTFKRKNAILSQRKIVARTSARLVFDEIANRFSRINFEVLGPYKVLKIPLDKEVTEKSKKYQLRELEISEEASVELLDSKYFWYEDNLLKQELEVLSITFDEIQSILDIGKKNIKWSSSSLGSLDNLHRSLAKSENEIRKYLEILSDRAGNFYKQIRLSVIEIQTLRSDFKKRIAELNRSMDGILKENHSKNAAFVFQEFAKNSAQNKRLRVDAMMLDIELDEDEYKEQEKGLKDKEIEIKETSKRRKLGL